MNVMRAVTVALVLLLSVVVSGCSIQEPDSSAYFDQEPADTASHARDGDIAVVDLRRVAGSRPARSVRQLVDVYTTLRTNVAADTDSDHLRAIISRSTLDHAVDVDREVRERADEAASESASEAGQLVGMSSARAGRDLAVYAIVRIGRYDSEGTLIGDTRVVVFTVGVKRSDAGYLVSSWQEAK